PPPLDVLLDERQIATQNVEQAEKPSEPVPPPTMTTGDKKVAFIYHTHSSEAYFPHLKGVDTANANNARHPEVNVTKVGEMLAQELEARGIGTEVDKTNMDKYLKSKGYNYYQSYKASGEIFASAMNNNRDLNYFIDIHRDAHRKDKTTITLNGKEYAKIAFIVGTDNPQFEKNSALAKELHQILEKKYPGLSRGVIGQ